jgi:hypothetical protein
MLATGSLVGALTALRMGAGELELLATRAPRLVRLGLTASASAPDAARAEATFRDELLELARESAELVWRELRRGVDDLDAFTRTDRPQPQAPPRRYARVKP